MPTPRINVRVPPELDAAVRQARPELADASPSVLVRAALALAAGWPLRDALAASHGRSGSRLSRPVRHDQEREPA